MKRDTERWMKLAIREDQEREREEREKRERQEVERASGQACGQACEPVERQAEVYIDDYYEFNDDY